MISVEEAVTRITAAFKPVEVELVPIAAAHGCVAAEDIRARMTQPPAPVSAMDGYAVRAADATVGAVLAVTGTAPAGHPFNGRIGKGEAVRIFTGGVVPEGADTVIIQENTTALEDSRVCIEEPAALGRNIRAAGIDFCNGDVLIPAGKRLSPRDLSLIAAGDVAEMRVRRRPRVAIAATGDELTLPGAPKTPGAIVASSGYGLSAYVSSWGGVPVELGIVPDRAEDIAALAERAKGCDLLVTMGGASVGEHDLIQKALGPKGLSIDFWKIAMRPGMPLLFGRLGDLPLIGLPGNPVSTLVCALLYLRPAIAALLGTETIQPVASARLGTALGATGSRQEYIRARLEWRDGEAIATPIAVQDSSVLSALAEADALIVRPPNTPAAAIGARVDVLSLDAL